MPSGSFHAIVGDGDHDGHLQHELKQIRPQDAPQSAERNVKSGERNQKKNADGQAGRFAFAEHRPDDAGHGLGHPAQDQAVHQQAEIDGAKSAQECRGLSGVAHFRELHVGEQARTPPQARKQEHGHHSRRQKTPPQPVPGDALRVDEARSPPAACPPQTSWPPSRFPPATTRLAARIRNILRCSGPSAAGNRIPSASISSRYPAITDQSSGVSVMSRCWTAKSCASAKH